MAVEERCFCNLHVLQGGIALRPPHFGRWEMEDGRYNSEESLLSKQSHSIEGWRGFSGSDNDNDDDEKNRWKT